MSKQRADRRREIERLLHRSATRTTVRELATRFGVTERTVFHDLAGLRSSGIPIKGTVGRAGGVALEGRVPLRSSRQRAAVDAGIEVFGYAEQRRQLEDVLLVAAAGQPGTLFLLGDAGQGKTHLSKYLARCATDLGFVVHVGNSLENEATSPYWPWVDVFKGVSAVNVSDGATESFEEAINTLVRAFPGLSQPVRMDAPYHDLDPQHGGLPVHEAGRLAIATAAQTAPQLVVLEDLQWADRFSLEFLHYLVSAMDATPVLVVGTARTGLGDIPPGGGVPLRKILSSSRASTLVLEGMGRDQAARLMRSVIGAEPPKAAVDAIYHLSGGNPFFIREFSRLLHSRGSLDGTEPGQAPDIPVSVRGVISQRLDALPPESLAALKLAAVLGEEFPESELLRASEVLGIADTSMAIRARAARGILEVVKGQARFRFPRELERHVLYESIAEADLPRYHAAVARAIELANGERAADRATELAEHYARAMPVTGPRNLARYSVLAGQQALRSHNYPEARAHFRTALALPEADVAPHDRALARLGEGEAESSLGYSAGEHDSFVQAFEGLLASGDVEAALHVALNTPLSYGPPETLEMLDRASGLVEPGSIYAASLRAIRAQYRYFTAGTAKAGDEAFREFDALLRIARLRRDEQLELRVMRRESHVRIDCLDLQEGIEHLLHCLTIAEARADLVAQADANLQLCRAYSTRGDPASAEPHAEAVLALGSKLGSPYHISNGYSAAWGLATCIGDWKSAKLRIHEMADWVQRSPCAPRPTVDTVELLHAYIASATGEPTLPWERSRALVSASFFPLPTPSDPALVQAVIALNVGATDHLAAAETGLAAGPPPGAMIALRNMGPFYAVARNSALGILAYERGGTNRTYALYSLLSPYAGLVAGMGSAPLAVDRALGLLASLNGQPAVAAGHFKDAISLCRKAGYAPELANAYFDFARVSAASGGTRRRAADLIERCIKVATSISMAPLADRARALQAQLGERRESLGSWPYGLSDRESQVLRLVAGGKTNREIAAELVVSVNTVQYHVRNILRRTGAANRAEAVAHSMTET